MDEVRGYVYRSIGNCGCVTFQGGHKRREDGGTDNGESWEISSRISLVVGRKAGPGLGRKKYRGRGNED